VDDLLRQGVQPWISLSYGNTLYAGGGGEGLFATMPESEEALEGWCNWVQAMAAHFDGRVRQWEIWNEPKPSHCSLNDASVYTRLFIDSAKILRAQNPSMQIWGLATHAFGLTKTSDHGKFVRQFLQNLVNAGKTGLMNSVNYHCYSKNPDAQYKMVKNFKRMVQSYIPGMPIRQGENGAPSEKHRVHALNRYPWTEYSQAKWYTRRMLGDFTRGIPTNVFTIININYGDFNLSMALIRSNAASEVLYAKPSYYGVRTIMNLLDGTVSSRGFIESHSSSEREVTVSHLTKGDVPIAAVWFGQAIPSDSLDRELVDLEIDLVFEDPVYLDAITGKVYELSDQHTPVGQSGSLFKQLPLWDSVIFITERALVSLAAEPA
jgi:hypothetical protein